ADAPGRLRTATSRPEEPAHRHPLAALLPRLVRERRVERVDLRELEDGATRELVRCRYLLADDDATRLAAYLQARSGGNPFYINEVLRTLEAERLLAATAD